MRGWINLLNVLIWLPIVLLYLLLWPFIYVYGLGLTVLTWYFLNDEGLKILIVQNGEKDPDGVLPRLREKHSLDGRALFLDFTDKEKWARWSLPVRLFWQFGPIPLPPMFTAKYLPAILVLRKFRRPKTFSFGEMSKDRETKFEELLAELQET